MIIATLPLQITLPASFVGGIVIGYAYFLALRATANLVVMHGSPLLALALTFSRLVLLGCGFYLAVLAGGASLLAALAGVLCARAVMLRAARVSP